MSEKRDTGYRNWIGNSRNYVLHIPSEISVEDLADKEIKKIKSDTTMMIHGREYIIATDGKYESVNKE